MFEFSLISLGSASALPTKETYPTAHALNLHGRFFLLDCGEGTQMQCCRYGISLLGLEALFVTHLHGDHIYGLPGLLSTYRLLGRTAPFSIYAPAALGPLIEAFLDYTGKDYGFEISFHPLTGSERRVIYADAGFEVMAFPLRHSIPCYGYLFSEKAPALNVRKEAVEAMALTRDEIVSLKAGREVMRETGEHLSVSALTYRPYAPRRLAYCTDTAVFPELEEVVRHADVMFHESTYLQQDMEKAAQYLHSTAAQAATLARNAGIRHLLLGHFSSRYNCREVFLEEARAIFPNVALSTEGTVFDIPLEKNCRQ